MDYDFSKIVGEMDFNSNHLVDCNGLMLTNKEISVLKRFNIDYNKCSTLREVLFEIENVILDCDDDDFSELDLIASTISERNYYQNTNK